jgi:hypothetical protein
VIDVINKRTGGSTKYINQHDEDYVVNMLHGEDYRKELLTEIIHSFLENENDFCEELKLKLLLAIDNQQIGFDGN